MCRSRVFMYKEADGSFNRPLFPFGDMINTTKNENCQPDFNTKE